MPGGERGDDGFGFLLGAPEQQLFLVQGPPLRGAMDQSALLHGSCSGGQRSFGRFGGGLVVSYDGLNAVLRVASGADQILLGVVHFVLVEFLLRVGNIELVVEGVFLVAGGFGVRGGELRYLGLIAF